MAELSTECKAILQKPVFVHLATIMPDGTPQVSPVWVDIDGDQVLLNSVVGRMKDRNIRRDPRISFSFCDPDQPYTRGEIRGRIIECTEEGAAAHIDKLAKKYLGLDTYPMHTPEETRVIYRLEITKVNFNAVG